MSEMIMRVARAISEADQGAEGDYRKLAIAAIEAMREATPKMIEAGWKQTVLGTYGEAESAWEEMIDEALKG